MDARDRTGGIADGSRAARRGSSSGRGACARSRDGRMSGCVAHLGRADVLAVVGEGDRPVSLPPEYLVREIHPVGRRRRHRRDARALPSYRSARCVVLSAEWGHERVKLLLVVRRRAARVNERRYPIFRVARLSEPRREGLIFSYQVQRGARQVSTRHVCDWCRILNPGFAGRASLRQVCEFMLRRAAR